jgi:hypothetical protein
MILGCGASVYSGIVQRTFRKHWVTRLAGVWTKPFVTENVGMVPGKGFKDCRKPDTKIAYRQRK